MISIERCKEILGENMTNSEVEKTRDVLYSMVESILDNYFEEFAIIKICKKQSSIVEFPLSNKVPKDMDLIVKNIVVESLPDLKDMRL